MAIVEKLLMNVQKLKRSDETKLSLDSSKNTLKNSQTQHQGHVSERLPGQRIRKTQKYTQRQP